MKKVTLFTLVLLLSYLGVNAQKATDGAQQRTKLALSDVIEIKFYSNYYGGTQTMSFNSVNDYANGKYTGYQILVVNSNKNYNITVKTNSQNFTYNGATSPAPVMPVSTLGVALYYNGTGGQSSSTFNGKYAPLCATAQNLITNGKNGSFKYFFTRYKATPGFAYPAGTYTTDVVYTATQI